MKRIFILFDSRLAGLRKIAGLWSFKVKERRSKEWIPFIFFLAFSASSSPRSSFTVKNGFNLSTLMKNGTGVQAGVTFGIGQEWRIYQNTSLVLELFFSTRGGLLKNKSVQSSGMYGSEYVHYYDIRCRFGSIDFPMLLRHKVRLAGSVVASILIGPCFSLGVSDKSRLTLLKSESLWDPEKQEYRDYDYDYTTCWDCFSWFEGSGFTVMSGLELVWGCFSIECRIPLQPYPVKMIRDVYVYEKIPVVHFLFGFHF
ncbi:outer membrane beta-barrel protein [bacterium]|nr:outer membrane beta-barrel protein [bacterium]